MVKIVSSNAYTRLEEIIKDVCRRNGLDVNVQGWSCKTFDILCPSKIEKRQKKIVAQLHSLVIQSGEIFIFTEDPEVLKVIHCLAEEIERNFSVPEVVLIRKDRPSSY